MKAELFMQKAAQFGLKRVCRSNHTARCRANLPYNGDDASTAIA